MLNENQPKVVSFWIGDKPLHYIHHISLKSFAVMGYDVTLFTSGIDLTKFSVPDGISCCDISEVFPEISQSKLQAYYPATSADLLRPLLIRKFDAIWVDTDVFCLQKFPKNQSHIFAHEGEAKIPLNGDGNINNAVLYLPPQSPTLDCLCQYAEYVLGLRNEASKDVMDYIESGKGHAILKHGPTALTHFLHITGEIEYQLSPAALYPIHFNYGDAFWDPFYPIDKRITEESLTVHFWDSQIRGGWYRRRAPKDSFIWQCAKNLGVNMQKLSRRK